MQDRALRVGQHNHAVAVDDLLEQHLHHRRGMRRQPLVALAGHRQIAAHQRLVVRAFDARQPERGTALMRLLDLRDMGAQRRRLDAGGGGRHADGRGLDAVLRNCHGVPPE
jgi:hypothetical protein